jgi:uncharacterized protein YqeY
LNEDTHAAMRQGDTVKRDTLRFLLADIRNTEIARNGPLDDDGVLGVMAREVRQRQESIDAFKAGNRPDLVTKEEAELAVVKSYLPAPASTEEIIAVARRVIAEVGAKNLAERGKVIPRVIAALKGKAGGAQISAVVTELLSAGK